MPFFGLPLSKKISSFKNGSKFSGKSGCYLLKKTKLVQSFICRYSLKTKEIIPIKNLKIINKKLPAN